MSIPRTVIEWCRVEMDAGASLETVLMRLADDVFREVVEESESFAEAARRLGVSRQAVHQRARRVGL